MKALLDRDPWPENLSLATRSRGLKTGLYQQIENLEVKMQIKFDFIIIDTLQKVKPPPKSKSDEYAEIYNLISDLDTFGRGRGTAFLAIHHTRKSTGINTDPFDDALGSVGLQGAVTTMMVLRQDRRENIAKFYAIGKDIERCEKSLERAGVRWISLQDNKNPDEKSNFYENHALRKAILKILETEESGMHETTKENLKTQVHIISGKSMYTSVYQLTDDLNLLKPLFWIKDAIIYRDNSDKPVKRNGITLRLISFQKIKK
jgi:RecA-family ATPase